MKALAAAYALPRLGSGPSLRNACAVEELQRRGLESEAVSAGEMELQCKVKFNLSYSPSLSPIADVNECDEDPCEGKGRCVNSYGSYTCQCYSGYSQVITQNRKFCQGEAHPK